MAKTLAQIVNDRLAALRNQRQNAIDQHTALLTQIDREATRCERILADIASGSADVAVTLRRLGRAELLVEVARELDTTGGD